MLSDRIKRLDLEGQGVSGREMAGLREEMQIE